MDSETTKWLIGGGAFLAKDFLVRAFGPAGDEIGKLVAYPFKALNERLQRRADETIKRAARLLNEAGRQAKHIPDNVGLPLIQGAAVEEDDYVRGMWAILLANAADPIKATDMMPAFVSILRELSGVEATVLRALYLESQGRSRIDYTADGIGARFNPRMLRIEINGTAQDVPLPFGNFRVVADNLGRLGLVEQVYSGAKIDQDRSTREYAALALTPLGHYFVEACTEPPAPSNDPG